MMLKSMMATILVITAVIGSISGQTADGTLRYVECQSSRECRPGHCCTIGLNRYSIPQCQPMREEGESCRPDGHITLNTTLYYPDGSRVELTDVYVLMCPCVYGLSCERRNGTCRDASQTRGFNHLLGEASAQDD